MQIKMKLWLYPMMCCSLLLLTSCRLLMIDPAMEPVEEKAEDIAQKRMKAARINTKLAMAYLQKGNIVRAKQKLMMALDEAPNIPEPWYSTAYFLEATGNLQEANAYYMKAVSIAPTRGDVQNNYGTYLCRRGHFDEAISHFQIAVKDPKYLDPSGAYENAGLCALKIPNYARAKYFFHKAILANPQRETSRLALKQIEKTNIHPV